MQSNTYGEVSIKKVAEIIRDRVTSREGEYNVMIGTDSQNFDKTKVVVVIALHEVGKGGVFFFDITRVRRMTNISEKLLFETSLSLDYASKLMDELNVLRDTEGFDYEKLTNFCIHVDAGMNGPSKQVIPEIVGWIKACGYDVVVKPDSIAASAIANRISK